MKTQAPILLTTLFVIALNALPATSVAQGQCRDAFAIDKAGAASTFPSYGQDLRAAIQSYKPGKNNRTLLMKVVQTIGARMGIVAKVGFGAASVDTNPALSASPGKIHIPESRLDQLMAYGNSPEEKLSILSFVVAHELAHIALKHPELHMYLHGMQSSAPTEIHLTTHNLARVSKAMETRADRIAAVIVNSHLALDPAPIARMFEATRDNHGGDGYPSADERISFVTERNPLSSSFDRTQIDEGPLLDQLLSRLH